MQVEPGHPRGLWVLFFTEMWERFSYYGMRALLMLYMTDTFLFTDDKAYGLYGAYTALVYLSPVFGGILGDRVLGYRRSVTIGAALMALGHLCMAIESLDVFYLALALLIVGNGFFKANMSTLVGALYAPGDPRRDAGYTIFYMAVNLGGAAAPILCGLVGGLYGWHWGFTLAGIGMIAGLANFLVYQPRFGEVGGVPESSASGTRPGLTAALVGGGALLSVVGVWKLIQMPELVGNLLTLTGIVVLVFLLGYSVRSCEGVARHRMWVALLLTSVSVVFWAFFEQAGSSLTLFTERNVDKSVLGWAVPTPIMQSLNAIFILVFGGLFAALWLRLEKVDRDPSIPLKFGLGIVQLGLGFVALWYGATHAATDGIVALGWLVLGYLLHTTGELCLSPVGLSMITKLSPPKITGMMMGTWYLSISFANYAAGLIARLMSVGDESGVAADAPAAVTVGIYGSVFGQIALIALAVGVVMMLVSPLVNRGTHGVN